MTEQLQALTNASIEAEEAEVALALYLLAERVREKYPTAVTVTIEGSDQGDWMAVWAVTDAEGEELAASDYDDDLFDLPSHLYQSRRYVWEPYVQEDLTTRRAYSDVLSVQRVLDDRDKLVPAEKSAPLIQILHTRDPDEGCFHTVFVDGARRDDVTIEDIDPGRGYERSDWDERIADWADDETPFGQAVHAALVANADSEYISDYDAETARRLARAMDPGLS